MTEPTAAPPTTKEKLRRTVLVLFILACLGGIGWGASHVREVDANGDVITETDVGDVEITGDGDLLPGPGQATGDVPSQDEVVERTFPSEGAEILQQQQIGIDLGDQYRAAAFYVQGTLLPEDDLVANQPPGASAGGPSTAEIVERTIPAEGAEILQQQQIGIEVGAPFRVSTLTIDRVPIDEDNLIRRDEVNQVFYQPGEGLEFEVFPPGRVCAIAEVEQATTGEPVRSVEWCFEVT